VWHLQCSFDVIKRNFSKFHRKGVLFFYIFK
jgi:hypothetical protein